MPGILIFSENTAIAKQLITAGLSLRSTSNEPVYVVTISDEDPAQFNAAGADKVIVLKGASAWPESYAKAIADLAGKEQASVCLIGGTLRGKDIAAKIAAYLKAGLVTEAQSVKFAGGRLETTRLMFGGLAVATEAVRLPAVATIAPRTFDEIAVADRQVTIDIIKTQINEHRVSIGDVCPIVREGADISTATKVVAVGRGLNKKEDLALVEELAQALGAEIGCSRGIAEDYHWLPVDRYIGISGQKVKPELYLSVGISGQVQHVAGIRDSKIIVAVDTNEKAPIFEAADYGIVGDMYEVIPLLTAALKK